jgi:hypothetical protein
MSCSNSLHIPDIIDNIISYSFELGNNKENNKEKDDYTNKRKLCK